jgi:hypothetical protein
MATTIDTIECPHCGFINALAEVDYTEFFKYKNDKFDKREYCPLCDWEMYENVLIDKKKVFVDPKPDQLKEAKKIMNFINKTEVDSKLDDVINDYILDKYEDLKPDKKKAETFFQGLIGQVFEKQWR